LCPFIFLLKAILFIQLDCSSTVIEPAAFEKSNGLFLLDLIAFIMLTGHGFL